jgi:broad specificity phosphatase PhoE
MKKKEIMIIRHGRSLYNVEATKDLDAGLTDFGHQQAEMVGKFLKDDFADWNIITSPFLRCLETAQHIADELSHFGTGGMCKCVVDGRLGEMTVDYHKIESLRVVDRKEKFPHMDFSKFKMMDFAHERMDKYLQRLEEMWHDIPNRTILVTHGSPVLSFIRMHEGIFGSVPLWNHSVGNCSMTWMKGKRLVWRTRDLYWEMPDKIWACGK